MRALVTGWFSFEEMGATAGDLLARDLVGEWLDDAGRAYDFAVASPFTDGVDWCTVDPADYSHLVFVCGPFGNGWPITELLPRFAHCRLIGVDLSMLQRLDQWDPFDFLLERDSSRTTRPDLTFLSERHTVPVVGLVLVHAQKEYEEGLHERAHELIENVLAERDVAVVRVDTRLDVTADDLRTAAQVESVIARMDAVVTTRLHGLVLALKNGVPVVAVDPVRGGAKIRTQVVTIGWPVVLGAEELSAVKLGEALDFCLTSEARSTAEACRDRAIAMLGGVRESFLESIADREVA